MLGWAVSSCGMEENSSISNMDLTSSSPSDMDLTNCEVPNESCPNIFIPDVNMNLETVIHKQPVASQVCATHPTIPCSDGYDCHGIKSALEHEVHRTNVPSCRCLEIPTAASTIPSLHLQVSALQVLVEIPQRCINQIYLKLRFKTKGPAVVFHPQTPTKGLMIGKTMEKGGDGKTTEKGLLNMECDCEERIAKAGCEVRTGWLGKHIRID